MFLTAYASHNQLLVALGLHLTNNGSFINLIFFIFDKPESAEVVVVALIVSSVSFILIYVLYIDITFIRQWPGIFQQIYEE